MGDLEEGKRYFYEEYGPGARDQRLELFGQGGWADKTRGSGWLALQAGDVSRPEALGRALDDELLGIGRAWKALETWVFTRKLVVVRELIRRYPLNERGEPGAAAGGLPDEWDPRLHHEVAAALGISLVAAGRLVNLAWTLEARLPGIGKALEGNQLDPAGARMIADETSVLEGEALFARAEEIILAGLAGCATWTALQRLVQRAVILVDPDGARKRREKAEREHARLRFWRENWGTCGMQATGLPADEALAANARIEGRARAYKAARIARPIDILRVMAYLDLLNEVTIAQRAAWAQADAAARDAEDDQEAAARDAELRRARDEARERARRNRAAGTGGQHPETGEGHGEGTDGGSPGDPGGGSEPGGGGPGGGGPGGGGPGGGGPGGGGPGGGGPGGGGPGGGGPGGGGPGGGGPGGWPAAGGHGDSGHGEGDGLDDGFDDGPGDGPLPEDPAGDRGDWEQPDPPESPGEAGEASDYLPCPACRGAGGGVGLPVRANLTLPAGALDWLAEWSAGRTGNAARGPTGSRAGGGGSGDGGPGRRNLGGPGPCPACGKPGSISMPVLGDLAFPLLTLLGVAERPGEAHGLGALDPGLVRDLTAAGARHPGSTFCITVTDEHGFAIGHGCCKPMRGKKGRAIPADPDRVTITRSGRTGPDGGYGSWILTLPGAPLPLTADIDPVPTHDCDHRFESRGYQPGDKLRHLIQVRDGKCSFPACSRHARDSDFEHATPYGKGGRTCGCNAHHASRSCHRAKQSPGWHVTKPRPGWTRWTTKAGRTYEQGPWRYPA